MKEKEKNGGMTSEEGNGIFFYFFILFPILRGVMDLEGRGEKERVEGNKQ